MDRLAPPGGLGAGREHGRMRVVELATVDLLGHGLTPARGARKGAAARSIGGLLEVENDGRPLAPSQGESSGHRRAEVGDGLRAILGSQRVKIE